MNLSPKTPADEVPMTSAFHQTLQKLPVGFSPFVRTVVGRLARIEDKLDEHGVVLKDVVSLSTLQLSLSDSPEPLPIKRMKMDEKRNDVETIPVSDSSSKGSLDSFEVSFQRNQPTDDRLEPERRPFFSIPFLADRKVRRQCVLFVLCSVR